MTSVCFFSLEKPTIASPKILSVKVGEDFPVSPNRTMRPFRTTHRVPSNGYLIYKQEKSLLPQFQNLTGYEIGALVAAGTEVHEKHSVPEMAYTGDTTFDCFLDPANADILQARILITEATYIDDRQSPAKAKERGHTHLMDIAKNAELFRDVGALVLVHLSDRYNATQADHWMRRCLPPWLISKTWVPTIARTSSRISIVDLRGFSSSVFLNFYMEHFVRNFLQYFSFH
ncbi:putative Ribonuclease Z, chloroplastic [Hypsibius exemplaris]|uniref:Ribonuclease Z, chloroplastic n=1 Tax=Hypsibius exemplaris TaxID=2072580 RepID=A0A1W0WPQ9_HYPEX|nr:putative Ribonuclease Z, chloroplastic [Hypsibius exemplaris]